LSRIFFIFLLLSINLLADRCNIYSSNSIEFGSNRGSFDGFIQNGSLLDLKDDLDLKKSKYNISATLNSAFKRHKFSFKLSKYRYSGKRKLAHNILYNSEQFAKSQMVRSKLDLKWARAMYRYQIIEGVNAGLDLNALRLKTSLNNSIYKKNFIVPSIAIDYSSKLTHSLALQSKISLTPYGKNRALDSYAGIAIKLPFKKCSSLHIGYQVSDLVIDSKGFQSDLNYKGIYAGFRLGF